MNNFSKIAMRETTLSELMVGREKVTTDDVIKNYPEGVTITQFDIIEMYDEKKKENVAFPVFTIKEDDSVCFFGGCIFTKIVNAWLEQYDGDIAGASLDLQECGGVKVRLSSRKTKAGNNLTSVEIIPE